MINYSRPVPSRLVWDTSVSFKRAWRKFWAIFQDEAIAITRNYSADSLGLLHLLFTPAEFQTINGTAPIPLVNPGLAADDATPATLDNQAVLRFYYNLQQNGAATLYEWLLATIPEDLLEPMKVDHSLRTRSILFIVTTLREDLGVFTI